MIYQQLDRNDVRAHLDRQWAAIGAYASQSAQPPPVEILRERYAQGELTRGQYQETLVDILKDRYVRGELDLAE